jgi:broad specificity phosphatase PhoE
MDKQLWIFRHAETELNRLGMVQGKVNTVLNDVGHRQSQALFERYGQVPFDTILVSGLQRTEQTMRHFLEAGFPVERHEAINELSWGYQEGMLPTEASTQDYQRVVTAWENGDYHARLQEGESAHELRERLVPFIEHLKIRPEKKLAICTHGRTLRAMLALMIENDLSRMGRFHHVNTCLYLVRFESGRFTVEIENDRSHWA